MRIADDRGAAPTAAHMMLAAALMRVATSEVVARGSRLRHL
jgi:hypothetical protein